jgi:hypothetical protein
MKLHRRKFVIGSIAGAGTLSFSACGGGSAGGNTAASPPTSAAPTPGSPIGPGSTQNSAFDGRQFQTWDGGSGPSNAVWSQKLQLPWVNTGVGDWLDANQTSQGPIPVASTTVAVGAVKVDVTGLVDRWISSGVNRGFYLRSGENWAFSFAGRSNLQASARPQLQVVTNSGTTTVECSCNAMWSPSSYQGKDSRETFQVARGSWLSALQFDTSLLSGPIQSATLSLTCLSLKYPGVLEIFELNPPVFRDGAGALPKRVGVSNEFAFDRGLGSHAKVLFAADFSDLSKKRWQTGGVASASVQVKDDRTGSTYLRGLIPKGSSWGCDLNRSIVTGSSDGVPRTTETELYGRYYVFLEEDWGSEADANKMPGWDGRFGWWNSVGYWQSTTGNGGARPTGLKIRNGADARWEYEGASMRGHAGTRLNDGNPYDDLFWVGNYIYHLDQVGPYGEPVKWTGVVLGKGRWYCIEQYIKMNSIVDPFDAVGNGTAVNDGEYRYGHSRILA